MAPVMPRMWVPNPKPPALKSSFGSGKGGDTISSGIEGAWKPNPTKWDSGYLRVLFKYEYELVKSPASAHQWVAKDVDERDMIVDAHDLSKKHRPMKGCGGCHKLGIKT